MPFDPLGKFKNPMNALDEATKAIANVGMEKTQEVFAQINLLLKLLQSAGYGIGSLDIELSLPPKVTAKLKSGPTVKEEKLTEILHDHSEQKFVTAIVASLIQANKLRSSVTVETLELEEIKLLLTIPPNITLGWKDKDRDKDKRAEAAA